MNSDQNNPDVFMYPRNFQGNNKVYGVVSAACLILMTMASVSLYLTQVDYTLPILTIAVLITFSLFMLSRRGENA